MRKTNRRRPANELDRGALERLSHRLTAPPGLCAECVHLRILDSGRSLFLRCGRADSDPTFRRYPPLPVLSCRGFQAEDGDRDSEEVEDGDAGS